MRSPYIQVALTYLRRWRWVNYLMFVAILFAAVSSCCASASGMRPPPVDYCMFAFFGVILFLALSFHIRQQFADSRSHLTPGFCCVHATVAAIVIVVVSVVLPLVLTWILGLRSVGLVAISLTLFSAALWLALLAWVWLTTVIGLVLAVGWFALFAEPVCAALVKLAQGDYEPLAVGLLVVGVATTALGMRRMVRLNEDMAWYHGWTVASAEQCRMASERSACEGMPRPGLRERQEERRVARLIEHARRSPVSWWSGARRWQVMILTGWPTWLFCVLGALAMLLFCTWIMKGGREIPQSVVASLFLLVLPMVALAGQFGQRSGMIGRELLLPVERGLYLRQLGAAAAISQVRCWSAVSVATLVWWLAVGRESVSAGTIADMMAISALSQVWLFAAAVWLMRHRNVVVVTGVMLSFGIGLLAPIVTQGFTAAPRLAEWRSLVWAAVGLLAILGMFLIWAAYRRWLVADFD
jgi:hypothetical protein